MEINDSGVDVFEGLDFTAADVEPTKGSKGKKTTKPKTRAVEPETDMEEPVEKKKTKKKVSIPPPTEEEAEAKQKLLMILTHYGTSPRLGAYLKKMGFKNLNSTIVQKKSVAELEELVARVRFCSNNKTNDASQDALIKTVMKGTESLTTLASRGRVDISGTTERCFADEDWLDMLEQIKIEYLSFAQMSLPVRFGMSTVGIAMSVMKEKAVARVKERDADLLAAPIKPAQPSSSQPGQPQPAKVDNVQQADIVIKIPSFDVPEDKKKKKKSRGADPLVDEPSL